MAKKLIYCLIGVMIVGIIAGQVAERLELNRVDFHPDASWSPTAWLTLCAIAAWVVLVSWLIAEVAFHCLCGIAAPPYRQCLAEAVLGGFIGILLLGMLLPCVSYRNPRGFAYECGWFMAERVRTWQRELQSDRYPATTMAELYAAWLQNPPTDSLGKKTSLEDWHSDLELCQTMSSYRHRSNLERLPNEDELAYCYCGEGVSFNNPDTVIFYEKPGLHAKAGDIRNVIYADGRIEKVPPSDWPRIAAKIERQQAH